MIINGNKAGASKLNRASISGGSTNFENAPCLKYRVNYTDNTSSTYSLTWENIRPGISKCLISFYTEKAAGSVDIISNDGTTIYLTINGDFMAEKYYTIRQKVRVGEKVVPETLQYNGEDVLYDNEEVQVFI